MTDFFDRNGNPVPLYTWAWLYEQNTYRSVARDVLVSTVDTSQALLVSTIWRGFDPDAPIRYLMSPERPRVDLIYETAIVSGERQGDRRIVQTWYVATERDALRAHDKATEWARDYLRAPAVIRDPVVAARPRQGWNSPPQRPRGTCQACGRRVRLTAGGRMVNHGQRTARHYPRCRGSHLRPMVQIAVPGHDLVSVANSQ